ncbi:MAG: Cna B-type domain-containing protein [Lachnospiraceae bacterium]|nr:Cna B-type domain-containing protein [Lachnospiraceae bacterium]
MSKRKQVMGTILAVALAAGLAGQNIYASDTASGSLETVLQTDAGSQNSSDLSAFGKEGASSNEGADESTEQKDSSTTDGALSDIQDQGQPQTSVKTETSTNSSSDADADTGTGVESEDEAGAASESGGDKTGADSESDESKTEDESADDTADSNAQITYPAVSLETTLEDGTVIHVDAPEGAFPEGIQMTVTAVDPAEILDALRAASGDSDLTESDVSAYDFDFWMSGAAGIDEKIQSSAGYSDNKDASTSVETSDNSDKSDTFGSSGSVTVSAGEVHNIEPLKEVTVSIEIPELNDTDMVSAYHLDSLNSTAEPEDVSTQSENGTAVITTDAFSIHAVVLQRAAVSSATSGITVDYNSDTTIHSVTDAAGNKIILYCMNDQLHWPHSTPTTPNVPKYTEETIEQFLTDNGIKETAKQTAISQTLIKLLYAGYPYNGFGLYEVVDQAMTLTEAEYNQFLDPPAYLRTDFPDSVGSNTFTYSDRTDTSKVNLLNQFLQEAGKLYPNGITKSGLTYKQLQNLPFWRAAYCMVYYNDRPLEAYSTLYISGRYVTEGQAYTSTSNAVWTLMYQNGVKNNSYATQDTLTKHLLDAANSSDYTILTTAPSSTSVSLNGDKTFTYSDEDGKWHTGALTLSAPSGYYTPFNLSLPAGVSEESGKTQIRAGESFSLVASNPPENITISLSASIPWMEGNLRVYTPVGNATASDGKGYQNMVGAVIRQTEVLATTDITRTGKNIDVDITKVWADNANQDGLRPTASEYASMVHLMKAEGEVTDVKAQVTDDGDNTYTVRFINLPKYESGTSNEITYWVTEDSIPGYTADKTSVSDGGTLTNTHVPENPSTPDTNEDSGGGSEGGGSESVTSTTVNVQFTKVWSDNNNQDGLRPSAAEYAARLHLMNGTYELTGRTAAVVDNGDNTYTITYTGLPKYTAANAEIIYSVKEDSIQGYTADKESVDNGGTLTNTHVPTAPVKTASEGDASAGNASSGNASSSDSALGDMYGAKTAGNGAGGSAPATGDDSNPLLYASLLAASGATLLFLLGKRKLRKRGRR